MTSEEYIRTKATLASIDDALAEGHLTPEERAELQALSTALSERLLAQWIPAGWVRRSVMLTLAAVGLYGLAAELYLLMWSLPFVAVCSPRIMGETFHSAARHNQKSPRGSSISMGG